MTTHQPLPTRMPDGLRHLEDFLSVEEERRLLAAIEEIPPEEWRTNETIRFLDRVSERKVTFFGWGRFTVSPPWKRAAPIPAFLEPVRERCESTAGLSPGSLEQIAIIRYPDGMGVAPHIDAPEGFGDHIFVISLNSPVRVMFRNTKMLKHVEYDEATRLDDFGPRVLLVRPRSLYVMTGEARYDWTHEVLYEHAFLAPGGPVFRDVRYAITLRTIKK